MSSPYIMLHLAYETPDGRRRVAVVPAESIKVDDDDSLGGLSAIVIALNDRVTQLERTNADLLAVLRPLIEGARAAMDADPAAEPGPTEDDQMPLSLEVRNV